MLKDMLINKTKIFLILNAVLTSQDKKIHLKMMIFRCNSKSTTHETKINKLDFAQIKNCHYVKVTVKRMLRKATKRKNISKDIFDKGNISKISKEL